MRLESYSPSHSAFSSLSPSILYSSSVELVQEFHGWLADQRDVVKECSDQSGDVSTLERKLQKLRVPKLLLSHNGGMNRVHI